MQENLHKLNIIPNENQSQEEVQNIESKLTEKKALQNQIVCIESNGFYYPQTDSLSNNNTKITNQFIKLKAQVNLNNFIDILPNDKIKYNKETQTKNIECDFSAKNEISKGN